jgi:hypothetical protein
VYGAVDPDHQITRPLKVSHEEESVAKHDHLDVQEGIDIIRIGKIGDLPRGLQTSSHRSHRSRGPIRNVILIRQSKIAERVIAVLAIESLPSSPERKSSLSPP